MASEAIEAIKNIEKNADEIEKKAKDDSSNIINKAKSEALSIILSKEKEATAKAELRINFSKNEAKEYLKNNIKRSNEEALKLENNVKEKLSLARELILKRLIEG